MEQYINKLPIELVNKIINYTDVVSFRNGKYIDRISKTDERYEKLKKIPRPIRIGTNKVLLKLMNHCYNEYCGYFVEYIFDRYVKVNIKFISRYYDGFDRVYIEKSNIKLIHDVNGNWSKIVYYSM
jgi:hypothetical protein